MDIKPSYYHNGISPFEYIKANKLDFFEGNVIKYITRHRSKNGKEDLIKARTYINELIKEYEMNYCEKENCKYYNECVTNCCNYYHDILECEEEGRYEENDK